MHFNHLIFEGIRMTHTPNHNQAENQIQNHLNDDTTQTPNSASKKSRFSPTVKGALIGAAAGSVLPVFGTISGAVIGAVSGKIYEKKYCTSKV